ncbi:9823_t:CDS:2 [Diversispora eburnea]|uniref:9823_t:CDS:1 n=1 Tax=Diversispora eburnea TaxID=1213867 RepID=A0A9N9B5D1_9GLOM|nr:9823_t:CDS:2 [Diversispora eburnea]
MVNNPNNSNDSSNDCSNNINWNVLEGKEFLEIWLAADEFMLDELERNVREFFEMKSERLRSNFIQILRLVYQNLSFERFRDETILYNLLNDEDYFVHDGVMWNLLIQWACAQSPKLNLIQLKNWKPQDFEILKFRIDHFLPFIKFGLISRNPKNDVLLKPNVILEDSKILNHSHAIMIARWIDTDGFDHKTYYSKCGGKSLTVVVATLSHSRFIVGGYYPINTQGSYPYEVFAGSMDAFIFSFGGGGENNSDEESSIISRVLKEHAHEAICRTVYGPGFGDSDLIIKLGIGNIGVGSCFGNNCLKKGVSGKKFYERKIIEMNTFNYDDIEVFQIIKI